MGLAPVRLPRLSRAAEGGPRAAGGSPARGDLLQSDDRGEETPLIDVAAIARECGFGEIAGQLADLALAGYRLEPGGDGPSRLAVHGALGGMTCFAEVDVPGHGLLRFCATQHPDHHGVTPQPAEVVAIDRPSIEGVAVSPVAHVTVPHWGAIALDPLGLGWGDYDVYRRSPERFAEAQALHDAYGRFEERVAQLQGVHRFGGHRLLGWPEFEQDDVFYEMDETRCPLGEWRLLVQIGASTRLNLDFGDGGALFFALPAADLAAGRFDRAVAVSQCG